MYFGYQKKGVYLLHISFSQVSNLLAFVSAIIKVLSNQSPIQHELILSNLRMLFLRIIL